MKAENDRFAASHCSITSDGIDIAGQLGFSGGQRVFIGFAPAKVLCGISYADVLDEQAGVGYQRRISREHSLAFKRYIQNEGATTIPLTFNLRAGNAPRWQLTEGPNGCATLKVNGTTSKVLTQVDGQHRLGFMDDSPIVFPFMSYIGLSQEQEMEVFRTINGRAKGLSGSLLDYTAAKSLGADLAAADPALFIALGLNSEEASPWRGRLDLGGQHTVGQKRIATLRTMHLAAGRMLRAARVVGGDIDAEVWLERSISFWRAIAIVLPVQWVTPRQHMLCKGIGVYALMSLAGHLVSEAGAKSATIDYFVAKLSDFIDRIDWTNQGPLDGFGGEKGADKALQLILEVRKQNYLRLSQHA